MTGAPAFRASPPPSPGWTPERVERLIALRASGLSCSEIVRELGWVSRNAVIGKLHRLGIRTYTPANPRPVGRVRVPRPKACLRTQPKPVAPPRPSTVDRRGLRTIPAACEPVGILDLTSHTCRYPVNDGEDAARGWLFCGDRREGAGPYCPGHAAIASNGVPRKREGAAA